MKKVLLVLIGIGLPALFAQAQKSEGNPFARLGYQADVYTFSRNKEFHDQDMIVEIGDVLYNTKTKEVVGFVTERDSLIELRPELQSMSIDPHAEKYYSVTPYGYCMNNPVNCVDPDGRDVWEINSEGNIINRIEDKTQDAFFMVVQDADGNYQRTYTTDKDGNKNYNSVSFEYGTVSQMPTFKGYDRYTVSGNENGDMLFEFLADNTNVEWGNIQYYTDNSTITTSHQKASLSGNVAELLINFGSGAVKSITHSHPSGIPYPSGLDNRRSDIGAVKGYENRYGPIDAYIYLPGNDKYVRENYIKYNSSSEFYDFRNNPYGFTLPTITIIGRKK